MNEFEKQVFNSLSEEEQEKIAGGGDINPDDDLTKEQCDKLKDAATSTALSQRIRDLLKNRPEMFTVVAYYGVPRPKGPNWPIKPQKPLQPLNPVTPEETQQSTTDPNATDKS